ncbi:MAG: adenosylcobinamide amidohydrolase [Paracoccaceae bacterium]
MFGLTLMRPWLVADLGRDMRVLSWALNRPGYVTARRIVWREVRNADLPVGFDAARWFQGELAEIGLGDAVAMLTSRDIATFPRATACVEGVQAECIATLGLSNAESVGARLPWHPADGSGWGTINLAVATNAGLTRSAQLEALSIAVEARTAAVAAAGWRLPTGLATGTGTDCVALAARPGRGAYAGLHTSTGEAVGRAVRDAVAEAATDWLAWRAAQPAGKAAP